MLDRFTSVPPTPLPTLGEIEYSAALIRQHVPATPNYTWPLLNEAAGCEVWLKHENHTPIGAFKVRGGLIYLDELLRQEPNVPGIIAASTGNHGQSIAYAARLRDVRAVIVVPAGNNPEKNAAMRALGAELVEHGNEFQDALEHSRRLAERQGLHAVPSFHPWLVRGVATYALELLRAVPPLDAIYVPIGLGSGICGVAAACDALGLDTRIVGVVAEESPAYALSFRQRRLIVQPSATRVSEGVSCSTPNNLALEWILQYVNDVVTISDDEARVAMREILSATHNVAEGAGALAWGAIRKSRERLLGKRVGCVLSGGNASLSLLAEAIGSPVPATFASSKGN